MGNSENKKTVPFGRYVDRVIEVEYKLMGAGAGKTGKVIGVLKKVELYSEACSLEIDAVATESWVSIHSDNIIRWRAYKPGIWNTI